MNRTILTLLVALALAATPTGALAQAAAETVLLNAHSAATTVKAGSALGSALNRATRQLAGQVSLATPTAASTATSEKLQQGSAMPAETSAYSSTTPASGPLVTSIAGASRTSCALTDAPPSTDKKSAAPTAPPSCAVNPPPQKYKSQVTVSFPD
jgi:hypothetical protein